MTSKNKTISSSIEKIKQTLDPACSYMIFEKSTGSFEEREFQEVFDILGSLKQKVRNRQLVCDRTRGRFLLVVEFDRGQINEIVQELLNIGLPEDMTLYAYDSPLSV